MVLLNELTVTDDIVAIEQQVKEKGIDSVINWQDLHKNSLLHIACANKSINVLDYLLLNHININGSNVAGDSGLILSTQKGDLESVKKLIEQGARVNHSNKHGNTALHYACYWRFTEIAHYLTRTAGAYVKIANAYDALPTDHTSKILRIALLELAKTQGDEIIHANSLTDLTEGMDAMNVNAKNEWNIPAELIKIGDVVAESSRATLYRGVLNEKNVVIKVLKIERDITSEEVVEIFAEITMIRKIVHPNIKTIVAACTVSPDICYLMEYEPTGNLDSILNDCKLEISALHAMTFALQIAKAVLHLHEMKPNYMVHGNLKNTNILVSSNQSLSISEFGFQKSVFNSRTINSETYSSVEWLAPEILLGTSIDDERMSDVYSFGLVLFSIITRQPLFEPMNTMVLGYKIAKQDLTPDIPDYIPESLSSIMKQCWIFNPKGRPSLKAIYNQLLLLKF